MEKTNVPAVGRLTVADLLRLKVTTLQYLDVLERLYFRDLSIFANDGAGPKAERARQNYSGEIAYTKLLLEKLDDTVQAILTGELEVSHEAVAHLPRKANR